MKIDVNALKNFKTLHVSQRLLFMIFSLSGDDGAFRFKPSNMAERIGTSERTLRTYLHNFAETGMIKFKYSGMGRVNPNFYYTGELKKFNDARKDYQEFKSDF